MTVHKKNLEFQILSCIEFSAHDRQVYDERPVTTGKKKSNRHKTAPTAPQKTTVVV